MIKTIDIKSGDTADLYQYLSAAVTPRPIAFVSSIDAKGNKNLSPFSFFNVFSIKPPILVFSPVRRVRNNTSKHTLDNLNQIKECVISLVTEKIVQQVSLSSCDFDAETNELVWVDTFSKKIRDGYSSNYTSSIKKFETLFNKNGAGRINCMVDESYVKKLLGYFKHRA